MIHHGGYLDCLHCSGFSLHADIPLICRHLGIQKAIDTYRKPLIYPGGVKTPDEVPGFKHYALDILVYSSSSRVKAGKATLCALQSCDHCRYDGHFKFLPTSQLEQCLQCKLDGKPH